MSGSIPKLTQYLAARPRGYKNFFMLNSTEHEILTAIKTKITDNDCWNFNIYEQDKFRGELS